MAAHYLLNVGPGETQSFAAADHPRTARRPMPLADFDAVFAARLPRRMQFYASITPPTIQRGPGSHEVMRQALPGMLWTKQYFHYDLDNWLEGA